MNIKEFIKECQKWDVFKKLSIYIVTSWLLIQVLGSTWESLGLPKVVNTYLLLILLVGFPFYIFFVWKYQISPYIKQSVADPEALDIDNSYKRRFQRIYFGALSIVALFALLGVASIAKNKLRNTNNFPEFEESNKIAVLKFDNNTGNAEYDIVGKMAADWLMHGITQYKAGQVVSPKIIEDYTEVLKSSYSGEGNENVITKFIKPSKVINGDFYLKDGDLVMQCAITDGLMNKTLISFDYTVCDIDNSLNCIEDLKQSALTYLIQGDSLDALNLQETPPKFDAYRYKLEAEEKYAGQPNRYLELLNKAIAADPNYFEPKVLRVVHFYNEEKYSIADSLLRDLAFNSRGTERQANLLRMYRSLLDGNNRNATSYFEREYNYAPFHLSSNSTMMVLTQQYINRPAYIDDIFNAIDMARLDVLGCTHCQYRYYIKAFALIELDKPNEAVALLEPLVLKNRGLALLKKALLVAYTRSGNLEKVNSFLKDIEVYNEHDILLNSNLTVGRELLLQGKKMEAEPYFQKVLAEHGSHSELEIMAEANYYLENFTVASEILFSLQENDSDLTPYSLSMLAVSLEKSNQKSKAKEVLTLLEEFQGPYLFGTVDYALARYHASDEDREKTIYHLKRAVASGAQFEPDSFKNDPHFNFLKDSPEFNNILTFWH
ncbi:tetratricopeptide repeat protein [Croceivirga thetidis]|uniref:Tetratricopeptide repeat protein n=1 Tax=Croceivirga thetidis TaxID=2721623 RepID=A0ABX1GRQ5_9FLAO|nr:hypothetical protein [Croceivirga thetidis]NKI32313.1 hypothetical protein [Croceivirga thetidis]